MILLIDARSQALADLPFAAFGLAPLVLLAVSKSARRRWGWLVALSVLLTGLTAGISVWDYLRLGKVDPVQVARGPLSGVWRVTEARRDFTKQSLSYRRTTTEGFTVGGEPFRYIVGGEFSTVPIAEQKGFDLKRYEGHEAEVAWFIDPGNQNEHRILRFSVDEAPPKTGMARAAPTGDFGAFWAGFSGAAAAGDTAAMRGMIKFPFMLGGHDVTADEFDTLWMGLFTPSTRACLAKAKPTPEQELMEAFCDGTIFIFAKDSGAWKFTEIGADD